MIYTHLTRGDKRALCFCVYLAVSAIVSDKMWQRIRGFAFVTLPRINIWAEGEAASYCSACN